MSSKVDSGILNVTYPTVVMVTNAHQNPSQTPFMKDWGNSWGFWRWSWERLTVKARKHIQHKKEKLVRSWFMDRRPGMLSKICDPEISVFVAPMFRSKKEKILDRYSQTARAKMTLNYKPTRNKWDPVYETRNVQLYKIFAFFFQGST